MEKFSCFTRLTKEYLHGTLEELQVKYDNPNVMHVNIGYEYNNYYILNYEVEIDIQHKNVCFISHRSNSGLNKVELNRESQFEDALTNYFFA